MQNFWPLLESHYQRGHNRLYATSPQVAARMHTPREGPRISRKTRILENFSRSFFAKSRAFAGPWQVDFWKNAANEAVTVDHISEFTYVWCMPALTRKKAPKRHAARASARPRRLSAEDVCDSQDAALSNEVSRAAARASAK